MEESDEDEEGHELVTYQEIPGASTKGTTKAGRQQGLSLRSEI